MTPATQVDKNIPYLHNKGWVGVGGACMNLQTLNTNLS